MFDDSIIEPIRKAIWEANREYKNVLRIHVTYDFYMQVKAKCTPPVPNIQEPFGYPILGYPVIEHIEPCEKEWWLEIEGEPMPQPVGRLRLTERGNVKELLKEAAVLLSDVDKFGADDYARRLKISRWLAKYEAALEIVL
jgi:hypothetical protein